MRRAAKVDDNQALIVSALRKAGCSVQLLHKVGEGCPDLLIGVAGLNLLAEVKDGAKVPSARKLTGPQEKWHDEWRGQAEIIESVEDALVLVNMARRR